MEFKQPTRLSKVPPRPQPPQRSEPYSSARMPLQPISTPAASTQKKLNISAIRSFLFSKKGLVIVGVVSVVIITLIIIGILTHQHNQTQASAIIKDPGYQTILPQGSSITKLGGWERISPPGSDPVFAYADKIGSTAISVSEQPLPKSFQTDTAGQVAELAKAYSATTAIYVNGTTVYIGTSAKGPQSVIFTKNNLLVLIKSHAKIDDKAWVQYISSLN